MSFYIEAGANDGISQSNTRDLEAAGWTGLLIEPNIHKYRACLSNRGSNNTVKNCALVSKDYVGDTITGSFDDTSDDSLCGQIIDDLAYCPCEEARIAGFEKIQTKTILPVPARTLQSILDEMSITEIDFMSLDVEGYEIPAMNGLDFNKNPPKVIRIETTTLENVRTGIDNYLTGKGYILSSRPSENDALYTLV